ncbi:MAG: DUF4351 domain-containing protein [Magnetococcus sp. YQC-5]
MRTFYSPTLWTKCSHLNKTSTSTLARYKQIALPLMPLALRLILAPLTMPAKIDLETLKSKGRAWQEEIKHNFPEKSHHEAVEIMILFALAHVRSFDVKEIIQLLNLDPNPDWVFTKIYNEGYKDGEQKGRQNGRKEGAATLLLKLMRRKFGQTPDWVTEKVTAANLELIEKWGDNFVFANSLDEMFAS